MKIISWGLWLIKHQGWCLQLHRTRCYLMFPQYRDWRHSPWDWKTLCLSFFLLLVLHKFYLNSASVQWIYTTLSEGFFDKSWRKGPSTHLLEYWGTLFLLTHISLLSILICLIVLDISALIFLNITTSQGCSICVNLGGNKARSRYLRWLHL